jgi:hypothetical protein
MAQPQGGGPEQRQVPPVDMLLDGLEMAEELEIQSMVAEELSLFNGDTGAIGRPRVIFGEGVVPDPSAKPGSCKYPRIERVADWRSEGRPGGRFWRERPDISFLRSRILGEPDSFDDLTDGDEAADLRSRDTAEAYEERAAEEQTRIRQSIAEVFEQQEAMRTAEEIPADEAQRLAEADTEEFEAVENPGSARTKSIYDSALFSPQSVKEYRAFRDRRRRAA